MLYVGLKVHKRKRKFSLPPVLPVYSSRAGSEPLSGTGAKPTERCLGTFGFMLIEQEGGEEG